MTNEPATAEEPPAAITEEEIDAAIAACDGDTRATIRALLVGQAVLERLLELAQQEASWGYIRGRPSRRAGE